MSSTQQDEVAVVLQKNLQKTVNKTVTAAVLKIKFDKLCEDAQQVMLQERVTAPSAMLHTPPDLWGDSWPHIMPWDFVDIAHDYRTTVFHTVILARSTGFGPKADLAFSSSPKRQIAPANLAGDSQVARVM